MMKRTITRHGEFGTATVIDNPKGSAIFMKSPLSLVMDQSHASLQDTDQCAHGAAWYNDETHEDVPAFKATSLLCYSTSLPETTTLCPGKQTHPKHVVLLSGKSGWLAVLPWKMG